MKNRNFTASVLALLALAGAATQAPAQSIYTTPYAFTNFAGMPGVAGTNDSTGSTARFSRISGVAVDSAGNVYAADFDNCTIRKVTPGAVVTTLAGLAGSPGSADGTGSAARFSSPVGVAADSAGNVYVGDSVNCTIRKITPAGVVTTLAGLAGQSGSADGTGSATRFNTPAGVAVDSTGNVYVADYLNNTIRKITPAGVVTTLAGLAGSHGSADGTGSAARFNAPGGVAVDGTGNVYVADQQNQTIRKITPAGGVTTLAGLALNAGSTDGTGSAARFYSPSGVAVDNTGNVYVADQFNQTIREITPAGVVTTLAGLAGQSGRADGMGSQARFYYPNSVAVDSAGYLYVADMYNDRITKGTSSNPLANGLLAYYPLTSDGRDQSGHGLNLTLSSVVFTNVGPAAWDMRPAGSFNGQTSYGTVNQSLIIGQTNWSWCGWLYGPLGSTGNPVQGIYEEGNSSGPCFGIDIYPAGTLDVNAWNVAFPGNWQGVSVPYVLTNGWNHLALTLAGGGIGTGTLSIFFNGVLTNTGVLQRVDPGNTSSHFGGVGNGWGPGNPTFGTAPWKGSMAGLRFYNRALSAAEVQQIYALEMAPCVPHAATATASVLNGFVVAINLTDDGCGYTNTPGVLIAGGGGTGATASAVVSDGVVVNIVITDAGIGYTNVPSVAIVPPFGLAPEITQAPQSLTVTNGNLAAFSVAVSGAPPLDYQWQKNGTNLTDGGNVAGSATSTLTLSPATASDAGNYTVIITNVYGSVTSGAATLTVLGVPSITAQPQSQTVLAGSNVVLSVTASGLLPMTFQWTFNGAHIAGGTNANLTLTNVQFEQGGTYAVAINNSFGSALSSNATLTVLSAPKLLSQPANAVGYWGESAALQVVAQGTAPLSYQWYIDGVAISWGTNARLSLTNLVLTDAGTYSVQVTNLYGSVVSGSATLIVNPAGVSLGVYAGLTISGAVGKNFGIQSATDLTGTGNWTTLTNLTLTQPVQIWVDTSTNVSGATKRFYRVVAVP